MNRIELPYRPNPANQPIVYVFLRGPERSLTAGMLVDSGADSSVIPWSLGIHLGFRETAEEHVRTVTGIGGGIQVRPRRLQMTLGAAGPELEIETLWAAVETPVLLGRKGIFDRFRVEFDQRAGKLRFSP